MSVLDAATQGGSRFGKLSSNMFFIRNTAKPKRVRHIEGLNGALICNVNDDPALMRSSSSMSVPFNRNNLPTFETPRRVERLVPPMGFWNTHGIIHDTDRWKQELAALASSSGLGLDREEQKHSNKPTSTADQQHASRSGAYYSTRTGRFNEGAGKSRGRTTSKHTTAQGDMLFNVPENEREMWMLQVLCQLLGTSNLEDVQSWLISATSAEKEQARMMINSALRGLKESERTSDQVQQSVDLNSLSTFVERQKHEEKYASQRHVKDILNRSAPTLQSIDEENQTDANTNESTDTVEEGKSASNVSLQSITTYRNAFPNYYQGMYRSQGAGSSDKGNHLEREHENDEPIDTIQLEDDRSRPPSGSLKKSSKKSHAPVHRSSSSQKMRHLTDSIQYTDIDGNNDQQAKKNLIDEHETEQEQASVQENMSSSTKTHLVSQRTDPNRSRKIRDLQFKLSRQEEESKKQFDELQSKQSRLENAIKLLVKQTSSLGKHRQPTIDDPERAKDDPEAPLVNVIIRSPRDSQRLPKQKKNNSSDTSAGQGSNKSKKKSNDQPDHKAGDYAIQDVKVQISLSRLDNHAPKVYTGVWKPDASTLQRLQGN